MIQLIQQVRKNTLLFKAILLSLAIHAIGLIYFYSHPLLLHNPWKSLFGLSSATPTLLEFEDEDLQEVAKNKQIEESFEQFVVLSFHSQEPCDLTQLPEGIALSPSSENETPMDIAFEPLRSYSIEDKLSFEPLSKIEAPSLVETREATPLFEAEDLPLAINSAPVIFDPFATEEPITPPTFAEEFPVAVNPVLEHVLPETDGLGVQFPEETVPLSLQEADDSVRLKTHAKTALEKIDPKDFNTHDSSISAPLALSPQDLSANLDNRTEFTITAPQATITDYALPDLATAAEWNRDFDMKLQFSPKAEGQGYVFSIELSPTFDISQYSLKQNFHFIIDRSSSVQKHRFGVFKRAVLKALSSLQPGESFNIYFADKHITQMSPAPIAYSMKAIQAAETFMDKQEAGGLFSSADIYSSLEKILPAIPQEDAVNTAILLTDGKSSLSDSKQQRVLKRWIEKNNNNLSIYTAAIGQKNDLLKLDLLSSISGGKLIYSDTHASFPRKLGKLILDLHDPIAKNLVISATPTNAHSHIELSPSSNHLPSLYSHKPYVIIGSIDEPCNFDLVIEGKHNDQWISIKKRVSFVEGEKAGRSLEKQWEGTQANALYSKFLKEGNGAHLKAAKEVLNKSRGEIVFE